MVHSATNPVVSLPALAAVAARYVRQHGPVEAQDLLDHVTLAADFDTERAQAGIQLALLGQRIMLDRDATVRLP